MKEQAPQLSWSENVRHTLDAKRRVGRALGRRSILSIPTGYEDGLNLDKEIDSKITGVVRGLVTNLGLWIPGAQFNSTRNKVPVQPEKRALLRHFSNPVHFDHHVDTVRNLFVAQGNPAAADIVAYHYMYVERIPNPSQHRATVPDIGCPTAEYYIVGLGRAEDQPEKFRALGVLSLAPTALELLAISDATMRLEPNEPLPEASISAKTRIYDLVVADQDMGLAA